MPLTDIQIRNAKPKETQQKLSDGGGLQLWIAPTGSKLWRLAYRYAEKQKKLALGSYPEMSLQEARKARANAKALLTQGIDPSQQKRLEKITKANNEANTFEAIASELLERKREEGKAESTLAKLEWLYGLANEGLAKRPIADITAPEILGVLKVAEGRKRLETARRLRAVISEVFRHAIVTARAKFNPASDLVGAIRNPKVTHRAAILEPVAFGGLLRAIDGFDGQPTTIAALKLMALLFQRPGELRFAKWEEFDFEKAVWTIPAARTKMRREHMVPLPRQAIAVLQELKGISGRCELVFQGNGKASQPDKASEVRPISENTLNAALRRLGYAQDEMSAHGFRATASTLLNESGKFSPDAIERALAHVEKDSVRAAYARGAYWQERVQMGQWWADQLDVWRKGASIINFQPKAG